MFKDGYRRFTVVGDTEEEVEEACDFVDECMEIEQGKNTIVYRVRGNGGIQPWDAGFISDKALAELQERFDVFEDFV